MGFHSNYFTPFLKKVFPRIGRKDVNLAKLGEATGEIC